MIFRGIEQVQLQMPICIAFSILRNEVMEWYKTGLSEQND